MHNEFTAIIEKDGDWYIAYCPEVPGANGQGKTIEESKKSLSEAILLIMEERRRDSMRGLPDDAICDIITISWKDKPSFGTYEDMVVILREKERHIPCGWTHLQERLKLYPDMPKSPINLPKKFVKD